jgi:hypothetical protein
VKEGQSAEDGSLGSDHDPNIVALLMPLVLKYNSHLLLAQQTTKGSNMPVAKIPQ